MVKCEFCDNVYYNKEKNCTSCGAPLPMDTTPTPQVSTDIRNTLNNSSKASPRPFVQDNNQEVGKKRILILCLFILFYAVVLGISNSDLFSDDYDDTVETDMNDSTSTDVETPTLDVGETLRFSPDDFGDFDKYLASFEANPSDKEATVFLSYYYLYNEDPESAYEITEKFIEQSIKDDGEIYIELANVYKEFQLYGFSYYILDAGFNLTKLESVKNYATTMTLDNFYTNTPEGEMLSLMFGKNLSLITYEDLAKIKAIYISSTDILYSMEDPTLSDGRVENYIEYIENMQTITTTESLTDGKVFSLFKNMSILKDGSGSKNILGFYKYYSELYYLEIEDNYTTIEKLPVLRNLVGLSLTDGDIAAIGDIEKLESLEYLELSGTDVYDITNISKLANLKTIFLNDSDNIKNLDPICAIPTLKNLTVMEMPIIALNLKTDIVSLDTLVIEDTELKNVDFLTNCTTLKELKLIDNGELISIPSFSNLTSLETLDINSLYNANYVSHIGFVSGLTNLKVLTVHGTLHDFSTLGTLTGLEELYLDTSVLDENLSPLSKLTNLKVLSLSGSPMSGYVPLNFLSSLTKLEKLDLSGADYPKGTQIFDLPNLKELTLSSFVGDFSKISKLSNLESLSINNMVLMDDIYIEGDNGFYSVYFEGERSMSAYTDSVGKITSLKNLSIAQNGLDNINFVRNLTNLESINLYDNYVTDLEPVTNLTNLKLLNVRDNPISNWGNALERKDLTVYGYND